MRHRLPRGACTRPAGRTAAAALAFLAIGCAAPRPAAAPAATPAVAAEGAERFAPGAISDERRQWRITFTPDGRTAYFAESDGFFPRTRQAAIHVSHRVGDGWSEPEVAPFSGVHPDIDPFVVPDGSRLYFSSIRPVDGVVRGDLDVWYVDRTDAGWGTPVRLGPEVNGPADELYPSAAANGDLYFGVGPAAPGAAADWDVYRAPRAGRGFAPRAPVAAVNTDLVFDARDPTADWEFNPEVSPDGRTLVFTSLRPGGHGFGDLYASHREGDGWSVPRNLGPRVNTTADEFHPTLSPDGRHLYFVRNDPRATSGTFGDFWRIPTASVPALRATGTP